MKPNEIDSSKFWIDHAVIWFVVGFMVGWVTCYLTIPWYVKSIVAIVVKTVME